MTDPLIASIIVLNWNKADLTIDCVRLVVEHTDVASYEVIVVDNGSATDQLEILKLRLPSSVRLISLNENMFFGEANNIGVEAAHGEYVLLLNNDVQVRAGYLTPLLREFENNYSVGAVGPKFLNPDGSLQEAGAFILPDGSTFQHGRLEMEIAEKFATGSHIVDYCSAACLLLRRREFLSIGGFDPLFDPAYFEDADLALRLRSEGFYTYYCSGSVVCHLENVTSLTIWSQSQLNDIAGRNHEKFVQRWSRYLTDRLSANVEPAALDGIVLPVDTNAHNSKRVRVLLTTSGRMEISDQCREILDAAAVLEETYNVEFAALEMCSKSRIRSLCRGYGIRLRSDHVRRLTPELLNEYDQIVHFGVDVVARSDSDRVHLASDAGWMNRLLAL